MCQKMHLRIVREELRNARKNKLHLTKGQSHDIEEYVVNLGAVDSQSSKFLS